MVCCLTAPCQYLNRYWLYIRCVLQYSHESNFTINVHKLNPQHVFKNYTFKITTTSPRGQWVNLTPSHQMVFGMWCDCMVDEGYIMVKPHENHCCFTGHDDVIKWKHFPRYWPFVRGIHRSPVNSPHKGQWCGALKFFLICAWIKRWVNNREAGDLRRHRAHYDVSVMVLCVENLEVKLSHRSHYLSVTRCFVLDCLFCWVPKQLVD